MSFIGAPAKATCSPRAFSPDSTLVLGPHFHVPISPQLSGGGTRCSSPPPLVTGHVYPHSTLPLTLPPCPPPSTLFPHPHPLPSRPHRHCPPIHPWPLQTLSPHTHSFPPQLLPRVPTAISSVGQSALCTMRAFGSEKSVGITCLPTAWPQMRVSLELS